MALFFLTGVGNASNSPNDPIDHVARGYRLTPQLDEAANPQLSVKVPRSSVSTFGHRSLWAFSLSPKAGHLDYDRCTPNAVPAFLSFFYAVL
jgi:hypothetical protein